MNKFSVLLLFVTVGSALGIRCYVCNSHLHPNCSTITESSVKHIKNCDKILKSNTDEQYTKCMWSSVFIKKEGMFHPEETRIVRDCSRVEEYPTDEKSCYYRSTATTKSNTCFCDSDACNPANSFHGSGALLIVCGVVAIAFNNVMSSI
ncbi:uncharacterized protein LOC143027747 [Oratosquilla oratoria]|uniref:uncharacterized protein LOC143027747 n=1 Tax=Oratosquilla oratoria TaxID=337810 RepID=UPI003F767388